MSQFARQALTLKHAYVAALLATSAAMVNAQSGPPMGGPGMSAGMGQHAGQGMGHGMGQRDPAKMEAVMAKRQEALKAKLKLEPQQEAAWTTFTASMKPLSNQSMARLDRTEIEKLSTPERIDKMRAIQTERHAAMTAQMDKRAEATKALYATLNPEQKKVFDAESFKAASQHHRHHGIS